MASFAEQYLKDYPDVAEWAKAEGLDPEAAAAQHYTQYGKTEGRTSTGFAGAEQYLAQNPDVSAWAGTEDTNDLLDALTHYEKYGFQEGREFGIPAPAEESPGISRPENIPSPTFGTSTRVTDTYNTGMNTLNTAYGTALSTLDTYYNEATGKYEPYTTAGKNALERLTGKIAAGPGELTESEGYKYRMDQAMEAIERRASAAGYLGDPRMAEEMQKTAQGLASDERQRFLDEYYKSLEPDAGLTAMGAAATGEVARMGADVGFTKAQMGMGVGQTALTAGMTAKQADVQSELSKYGYDISKYSTERGLDLDQYKTDLAAGLEYTKLGLAELLALRDQAWKSGETELQRTFEAAMAEQGYEFYAQMRDKNESANWWNSIMLTGAYIFGSSGSSGRSSFASDIFKWATT